MQAFTVFLREYTYTYFHITYRGACTRNQTDAFDWKLLLRNEVCWHALEEVNALAR